MKTLFISRNSPFESIGGIERYITNLIAYYKLLANSQLFLMLPTEKEVDYIEKDKNITIYYSNSLFLKRSSVSSKKEISQKAQLFSENLTKIITQEKIDIICAENFHTDLPVAFSLLLTLVTMTHKIPLVLQMHSFSSTDLQTEIVNQLKWDRISCVSKSVAGDCFQKGTDINYISTHYLGVDTNEFNAEKMTNSDLKKSLDLKEEDKIILTATRIIKGRQNILQEKGLINLIEAFSKITSRFPNVKLLIAIGKPPENLNAEFKLAYDMLKGYIKLHNIEDNTILKMFKLNEMADVYKASDVFVLTSENETFGQVFIESMASGTPVIGTKTGGIPEIISDSYNGYLIPPNDASILAQKIEKLLVDTSLANKFINAGIKTVKSNFSAFKQFSDFQKDLESLVTERQNTIQ